MRLYDRKKQTEGEEGRRGCHPEARVMKGSQRFGAGRTHKGLSMRRLEGERPLAHQPPPRHCSDWGTTPCLACRSLLELCYSFGLGLQASAVVATDNVETHSCFRCLSSVYGIGLYVCRVKETNERPCATKAFDTQRDETMKTKAMTVSLGVKAILKTTTRLIANKPPTLQASKTLREETKVLRGMIDAQPLFDLFELGKREKDVCTFAHYYI